jgi:hypothetical protein
MARYRTTGRLDDQVLQDGDRGFRGIDSYQEATSLEPGFVRTSENMRLIGDLAEVRKGIDFLAGSVTLTYNGSDERVFASTLFSDPATGTEFVVVATKSKAIIWNDANNSGINIDYPGGEVVAEADGASFVQSLEKLILFRGKNKTPLEWDGDFSSPTDFVVKANGSPGAGRIQCPNTDYGVFFRNRLIIPQPTDSNYTVLMSDLLDTDNYYAADSQFRINSGSADFLVSFFPYQEDQLIVFMRNSIHMINNIATTSAANTYEITRQHGCVARKSIAQSGPQTFFLSDNGVIVLSPGTDPAKGLGVAISKISGETIPMTRPIQDKFDEVNFAAADKSCGVVYDNKYYLAVPTGSSQIPNSIFVFDLLSNSWISASDSYPAMAGSLAFHVDDWVICSHGSAPTRRRLFACNDTGFYLMEENSIDDSGRKIGSTSESGTTAIAGKLVTRSFTFGDINVKSWKRGQLGANTVNADAFNIKVNTLDPDSSTTVLSHTADGTEEALFRFGTGRTRGYGAEVEINVTAGRPSFRHVSLEAIGVGAAARREIA